MSTVLKQFLQEHATKHMAEAMAGKAVVDEWRASIEKLFANIRAWLKESDSEGVIEIKENEEEINEPGLGRYCVPRLDLRIFGKWIGIVPKARRTVGTARPPQKSAPQRAEGRVDITDELRRYVLYRLKDGDQDVWVIDAPEQGYEVAEKWPGAVQYIPMSETKPLSQESFEKALMSYLR